MYIAIDNLVGDYYRTVPSDGQLDSTGVNEIALVGLGRWGGRAVLNTLTRRFPDMVIHAVARSNYQQWLSRKGLPHNVKIHTAKRYEEEILNNPTIKVVIITTQFTTHYGLAKKALLAGKDVFVEKPFTKTAGEAEKLIKIAKENNRILAIGYEFMYDQNINHLKRAIVKNRLGKVSEAEFNMLNPLGDRKLDTSSNVIEDLATHMLSLAQLLFGKKRISELKLDTNSYGTGVFISFKYDGIKITLNVDRKYKRAKRKRTIFIKGSRLIITLDYQNGKFRVQDIEGNVINNTDNRYPNELLFEGSDKTALELELEAFLAAIKYRRILINSADVNLWISKFIDRANGLIA